MRMYKCFCLYWWYNRVETREISSYLRALMSLILILSDLSRHLTAFQVEEKL